MTRILYSIALPETQQPGTGRRQQAEQAVISLLSESQPAVERVASNQADLSLDGTLAFRDDVADKLSQEIAQLSAADIPHMALRRADGDGLDDQRGYYQVADAEVEPVHAAGGSISEYSVSLNRVGTTKSHDRFTRVRPRDVFTPFSSAGAGKPLFIAPFEDLSAVSQYDAANGEESGIPNPATPQPLSSDDHATAESSFERFSADDLNGDRPGLVTEPTLPRDGRIDPRVWDDRGNDAKRDADGVVQWVKVLNPAHEFDGDPVIEDGRVRVRLRLQQDSVLSKVRAEQYSSGSWSTVIGSGAGTGVFARVDFTAIQRTFVEAFLLDDNNNKTRLRLVRDGEPEVFLLRDKATSTANGLESLLQPVAVTDRARIPAAEEKLLRRTELRNTDT